MKNIRQRIHAVMQELNGVSLVKTKGLTFKIIQHDDVTEALRPLYIKYGIDQEVSVLESRQLEGGTTELMVKVVWVNVDDPSDRKETVSVGHATSNQIRDGQMRRDDLGVGKALSYAVKMAQLKNFALLSGDEDIEREQAKPAPAAATTEQVEAAINAYHACRTLSEFNKACSDYAGLQLTEEQKRVVGAAWKAAKDLVNRPAEQQSEPLPETLGNGSPDVMVGGEPTTRNAMTSTVELILIEYKNVRTVEQLKAVRLRGAPILKELSPAQKQILKEADDAANKVLTMQQQAAQS